MKLHNISFGNIKRRKAKMLFLIMGLIIGISIVVTLLSIVESMTQDIEERLNQFGANIVVVPKTENLSLNYGGISVGGVNYNVNELDQERLADLGKIKNAKNLAVVAPKVLGAVTIKDREVLLMGVEFKQELHLKTWWMKKGGAFPWAKSEVVMGSRIADLLGFNIGDEIELSGTKFTISTILKPTGAAEDDAVIADLLAAQKLLGKEGKISMIEISAFCQGCPIAEMTLQIAEKFPGAKVTAMKQAVMSKMQSIDMFKSFSLGVSVIVILIGSLMVLVTMMGSVNERTREIGIFRAIGFRQGHVMQIILLEALILGVLGGLLGFVLGSSTAWVLIPLVMKDGVFAGINMDLGAVSILMAAALSLLASLYPAFKASRMDPTDALRAL